VCGNGIVEAGEMCDGQPECGADCKLHVPWCCSVDMSCAGAALTIDFSGLEDTKVCFIDGAFRGQWGAICVPSDPSSCSPDPLVTCGSCQPAPSQPTLTVCCQAGSSCTQETVSTGDALAGFGWSCLVAQVVNGVGPGSQVVLGTCGGDGHCVPQP
jgi:hypothetical protein